MGNVWNWVFIFFLLWSFLPLLRQRQVLTQRYRLMRGLERRRGSRLITLIHRQEAIRFLGLAIGPYITIDDSEEVLRAIRLTPSDVPIDLVLHTPGGLVLAAEQIAQAIAQHPARVTVFVPHYAMSGGTLIALAADELVMDPHAVLGPVDPQIGQFPAASVVRAVNAKGRDKVSDETLILADVAEKALRQVYEVVLDLLAGKLGNDRARQVADLLTQGHFTHDYPLTAARLQEMGLQVSFDMPLEIYALMDLYPQAGGRRPSVQYIPLPYGRPSGGAGHAPR